MKELPLCERCGCEHDPMVSGEWSVCGDCLSEALAEQAERRKAS